MEEIGLVFPTPLHSHSSLSGFQQYTGTLDFYIVAHNFGPSLTTILLSIST